MHAPHTDRDVREMLDVIGAPSLASLAAPPKGLEVKTPFDVAPALPESLAFAHLARLAGANSGARMTSFLGAGAYRHYQPPAVPYLATRSEFITAYTPYQAEASQGSLQAIFEWQTYVCLLTGLDVSNASLYDGSTALVEGVIMASQATGRRRVALSRCVHPGYRAVFDTYARGMGIEVVELPVGADLSVDMKSAAVKDLVAGAGAVIVQSPNFFGCIEDVAGAAALAKSAGALTIQVIVEAMSLGVLKTPAESGADIALGEMQSFGLPVGYGGPYVGFIACTKEHVRRLPGRLVGETHDVDGRRAFVLTLQGREQHIRRELASSNICTNQALCALFATIYLATVGAHGLRSIATANMERARELRAAVLAVPGIRPSSDAPYFNEFVVKAPLPAALLIERMERRNFLAGVDLSRWYPDMPDALLMCATELTSREDIAAFTGALATEINDALAAV
jgi:glycine dehydrogenase subunit 1